MKIWIFSICFWHFLGPKTMSRRFRSFGKVLKGQKNLKIAEKSSKYHISEHCHHFCLRHLRKSSTFLMFLRFSKVQTVSDKIETYSGNSREHAYKMKEPTVDGHKMVRKFDSNEKVVFDGKTLTLAFLH